MRDYGKVHTSFWSSATTRSLSEDGRTLALYLLTCPHGTIAGVFRLPDGYACEDLQWEPKRVHEGFAELLANGFANRCETTKWVWVTKYLEWNQPENPNQRKAVAKIATQVPAECAWNLDFMRVCGKFWGAETPAEAKGLETVKQPFLNQEQEQEQEQEQKKSARKRASPTLEKPDDVSGQVWADWLKLRKDKRAAVTETVMAEARREAGGGRIPRGRFLAIWCIRGSQGLQASWLSREEIEGDGNARSEKSPQWALDAGFPTVWEAENALCFERNAHEFRDGKRIGVAA